MAYTFDPTTLGAAQQYYNAPVTDHETWQNLLGQQELEREVLQPVYDKFSYQNRFSEYVPNDYNTWVERQYAEAARNANQALTTKQTGDLTNLLTNYWGQMNVNPSITGINRADELAGILAHFGIVDPSQIGIKAVDTQMPGEWQTAYQYDNEIQQWRDPYTQTNYQLTYGDKTFGDLGGVTSAGAKAYLTTPAQQYLEKRGDNLYRIAGSSAGKGVVDYMAQFSPEGKLLGIVPQWRSSSDAGDIRRALLTVGAVMLGGMGLESLLGTGAAAGAGAGAAWDAAMIDLAAGLPTAGTGAGAAAGGTLGSLGSVTQLGTPLAELGAVGLPMAEVGLPSLLAPEVVAPATSLLAPEVAATVAPEVAAAAPEVAGPGLLPPMQTVEVVGSAAKTLPWYANIPPAAAAASLPVVSSLTSTPDPYANETAKLERQQPGDLGNMGGPGTPEVPTVNLDTPWDKFKAWAVANPELARLAFSGAGSLLSASGGSGGSPGGYKDSGWRPTISRGGWNPNAQARQMPMQRTLLNLPTTGNQNSGLWRYGLLGG